MFRRQAFTLIELLVVISIIGVLVGLLLPVLSRARAQSQDVTCRARLQQIFYFQTFYASDNSGYYTPIATTNTAFNSSAEVRSWPTLLARYTRISDASLLLRNFNCPSIDEAELVPAKDSEPVQGAAALKPTMSPVVPDDQWPRTSYGLNSCMMMRTWGGRQGRKLNVSELIFMGEKSVNTLDYLTTDDGWYYMHDSSEPDNCMWVWQMKHSPHSSYRHSGDKKHANALMADGHVEQVGRTEMGKRSGWWFKDDGTIYSEMIFAGPCCQPPS